MAGIVNINGVNYTERTQQFPLDVSITSLNQVLLNQRLVLPGTADFRLKTLTRNVTIAGVPSTVCPFKFKFGNSDGSIWYSAAGNGNTNDRVVDSCIFGTGQFPYVITPNVYYSKTASILFEIENISAQAAFTIQLCFGGAFLIPA